MTGNLPVCCDDQQPDIVVHPLTGAPALICGNCRRNLGTSTGNSYASCPRTDNIKAPCPCDDER